MIVGLLFSLSISNYVTVLDISTIQQPFSSHCMVNKPGWQPLKLDQTGKHSYYRSRSIYCRSSYGPTFGGGHDIRIYTNAASNNNSYSQLGYTYSPPPGYSYRSSFTDSFLAGSYHFRPDEVEVFYETT